MRGNIIEIYVPRCMSSVRMWQHYRDVCVQVYECCEDVATLCVCFEDVATL